MCDMETRAIAHDKAGHGNRSLSIVLLLPRFHPDFHKSDQKRELVFLLPWEFVTDWGISLLAPPISPRFSKE